MQVFENEVRLEKVGVFFQNFYYRDYEDFFEDVEDRYDFVLFEGVLRAFTFRVSFLSGDG